MRLLLSPLKVPKSIFWLFMAFVLCFMLVIQWLSVRDGIPEIKAAVLREAALLSRAQDTLQSLQLGRSTRTVYKIYKDGTITGYFQFDGSYSNESWEVVVSWSKADTNAPIDKIKLVCASQEPKIIWSRK